MATGGIKILKNYKKDGACRLFWGKLYTAATKHKNISTNLFM